MQSPPGASPVLRQSPLLHDPRLTKRKHALRPISVGVAVLGIVAAILEAAPAHAQCDPGPESLFVEVIGDSVRIFDERACLNCASEFEMSVERIGDSLIVMEIDTQPLIATCSCTYGLQTMIVGLPAGRYTAVVYRDIRVKFPGADLELVGSVQFECGPSGNPEMSATGSQSGCRPQGVGEDRHELPHPVTLLPNYPNPFNPFTTIRYGIPSRSHVTLTVFNTLGQEVATLVQGEQEAGYHDVQFDASGLSSGVYLCRLQASEFVQVRKLTLLR